MFQLKQVEVLYSKRYWSILATFRVNERVNLGTKQESPPVWTQEAYCMLCSKYMLCGSSWGNPPSSDLGSVYTPILTWDGGTPPSWTWDGVPLLLTWDGGTPPSWTWVGVPPILTWDGVPPPHWQYRVTPLFEVWTDKLKTVPSPILLMRVVIRRYRWVRDMQPTAHEFLKNFKNQT